MFTEAEYSDSVMICGYIGFNGYNVFWQNPFNFALSVLNASNKSINQKSMGEYPESDK